MSREGEKTTDEALSDLAVVVTSGTLTLLSMAVGCVGLVGAVCEEDISVADAGGGMGGGDCSES